MPTFPAHWSRITLLSAALWPLSVIYGAAVAMRRALYRAHVLGKTRVGVPVIVLGNLFVGGTGKTPLVLALAKHLCGMGFRPGIVCRGYRGSRRGAAEVLGDADPLAAGDEPVLLARASGCPVWSGRDRVAAARGLLSAHPECDVILCDDGLQHYALARDLEIEVIDGRGHGNGLLLPAGPLREPASRHADALVYNVAQDADMPRLVSSRPLPAFRMTLMPGLLYRLDQPEGSIAPEALQQARLHALAGTGNPQRFFQTVKQLGLTAVPHAFPDHHAFHPGDLEFPECDAILMTEKDAVKCSRFKRNDLYALRVEARVEPGFFEFVRSRLAGAVRISEVKGVSGTR